MDYILARDTSAEADTTGDRRAGVRLRNLTL
jgi:hypothetical protein